MNSALETISIYLFQTYGIRGNDNDIHYYNLGGSFPKGAVHELVLTICGRRLILYRVWRFLFQKVIYSLKSVTLFLI